MDVDEERLARWKKRNDEQKAREKLETQAKEEEDERERAEAQQRRHDQLGSDYLRRRVRDGKRAGTINPGTQTRPKTR